MLHASFMYPSEHWHVATASSGAPNSLDSCTSRRSRIDARIPLQDALDDPNQSAILTSSSAQIVLRRCQEIASPPVMTRLERDSSALLTRPDSLTSFYSCTIRPPPSHWHSSNCPLSNTHLSDRDHLIASIRSWPQNCEE